jgi:ferritin
MISKKIHAAFNEQINHEIYSGYLYLSMSAYFISLGLDGFAHWMRVQRMEEEAHAMKFFEHLRDRDARIELDAIDKPKLKWTSPLEAFKAAYEHEKFITGKINALYALAEKESDYPAKVLLDWFVKEQVEEEASTSKIVQLLGRIKDSGSGLVMLDKELGKREFHG